MKEIEYDLIVEKVKEMCMDANYNLPADVLKALEQSREKEESEVGKAVLEQIIENANIAREEKLPICQDCGFAVFFVEIGDNVKIKGGLLKDAIEEGVRQGYKEGYLRKSIVSHPIERNNTGDNTPVVIHIDIVKGEELKISIAPKGGGSENMSTIKMLKPSDGYEGIVNAVVEQVKQASGNPCPPIIVGVGIGGTFEKAAINAKKALLRDLGSRSQDPLNAKLEEEILEKINNTGIGPMGFGGRITCLGVFVESYATHIASMPCAINIQCHAARHKTIVL